DKACIDLFRLFEQRSDVVDKQNPTASELRGEFELMALDDARPGARDLANQLGISRENSAPMLAVLNADGQLAATLPLQLQGDKLDASAVARFLKTHKLPTRNAEKLLADGLARAQADDKRVFFIFSASWCSPCAMLVNFLARHKVDLEQHYVFVKLDISREDRADELRAQYKESNS